MGVILHKHEAMHIQVEITLRMSDFDWAGDFNVSLQLRLVLLELCSAKNQPLLEEDVGAILWHIWVSTVGDIVYGQQQHRLIRGDRVTSKDESQPSITTAVVPRHFHAFDTSFKYGKQTVQPDLGRQAQIHSQRFGSRVGPAKRASWLEPS